jgi:hypothetical protein
MPQAGPDTGVPRAFAAARLGVSPHTVSMWAARGYVARWTDDAGVEHTEHRPVRTVGWWRGHRLYRWGDLVEAEHHTRNTVLSARHQDRSPATGSHVGAQA